MATKYARAVGGNWTTDATWSTTSGGAADTTKPTAADDAVIDAASGNVTIDSGAVCRSLDCNTYTGTLTHSAAVVLTIGDTGTPTGGRALRLVAGMTYTLGSTASEMKFQNDTGSGTVTATTAGKTLGIFNARTLGTGVVQLADALTCTTWSHTSGTHDTNNQTISASLFSSSNSNARTLTLGSSAITLSSTGTAWSAGTVTNLTVTANTATVTLSGAGAVFTSGSKDWNGMSVSFTGSGAPSFPGDGSVVTVGSLTRTGTAAKTDSFSVNGTVTCTGTFTATGNSATNRVLVYSNTLGTARTITAATVSLTNVDFRDITGAGAATWSGTSIGNALGNTGITFTTPVTVTHNAGAAGNWSTAANWDGGKVPLCHDTVVIPATTTGTLTNDMPRMCADLTCTGFTGTFSNPLTTEVYGSVVWGSGMTLSNAFQIGCYGRSSHTITHNGKTIPYIWRIVSVGGTYTATDAGIYSYSGTGWALTGGTYNDGGFSHTITGAAGSVIVSPLVTSTLTISGTWTISSTTQTTPWACDPTGTLNHTGTIILSGATATDRTFAGGGKTYGTLTDQNTSTGKLTITGQNTFGTINKTATVACTLALPTSSGITVTGEFLVRGISGAVLTLTGDVTKAGGTVSCDYLAISSSDAAGGATFYAGANSSDGGTNTGWIFGAPTGGRPYKGGTATVKESDIEGALVIL